MAARRPSEAGLQSVSRAAHFFVSLLFVLIAMAFFASSIQLLLEFPRHWETLLFSHSHLFFFFPIFGSVALVTFYKPAVVLTDLYWRHFRAGGLRWCFGFAVLTAFAVNVALQYASAPRRGIWEISPAALAQDVAAQTRPIVSGCRDADGRDCLRQPVLTTLQALRDAGLKRSTITEFARPCAPDPLVEVHPSFNAERMCFPAGVKLDAVSCCRVQARFEADVRRLALDDATRSQTSRVEEIITGIKAFFVLVLLVVSVLLLFWRDRLYDHYRGELIAIERGAIVGVGVMLVWLLMDYGYQQTADVLFGRESRGFPIRLSLAVAVIAITLIVYFLARTEGPLLNMAQLSTIGASGVAVFNYELIGNASARLLGSGAEPVRFIVLIGVALFALQLVYGPWKLPLPQSRRRRRTDPSPDPMT